MSRQVCVCAYNENIITQTIIYLNTHFVINVNNDRQQDWWRPAALYCVQAMFSIILILLQLFNYNYYIILFFCVCVLFWGSDTIRLNEDSPWINFNGKKNVGTTSYTDYEKKLSKHCICFYHYYCIVTIVIALHIITCTHKYIYFNLHD